MKDKGSQRFRPIHYIRRDNLIRVFNAWKELGIDRTWTSLADEMGVNRAKISLINNMKDPITSTRATQFENFFNIEFGTLDVEKKNVSTSIDFGLAEKIASKTKEILSSLNIVLESGDFEKICEEAYEIFKATGSVSPARLSKLINNYISS